MYEANYRKHTGHVLLAIMLMLILLVVMVPGSAAPLAASNLLLPKTVTQAPNAFAGQDDLMGVVVQRTADSVTYAGSDDGYRTILASAPLHYQDENGDWQVIDPAFRPLGDSFVVEHNTLRSRVGSGRAWISVAVGETAVYWQAQTVGTTGDDDTFTPLAHSLTKAETTAELNEDGRILHYDKGWSDTSLTEEISSAPGSLEHALILAAPPKAAGTPQFLEMQATLRLLPGATLWAEGEERAAAFETDGALEIRDAAGEVALVFDPVIAFEEANPVVNTPGLYAVQPGDEAGTWLVSVRTPYTWWADSSRVYPVVLDPTMHVLHGTGYGDGLAWIGDKPGAPDEPYRFNEIILGTYFGYGKSWPSFDDGLWSTFPGHNSQAEGYIQFNSLPGLLQNSPMKIKAAHIDVQPLPYHMPYYYGSPDWDEEVLNWKAEMFYVGACPSPTACPSGFSLQDDTLTGSGYTWDNRPFGEPLAVGSVQTMTTDPIQKWQSSGWAGELYTTSWDVTSELSKWYDGYYTDPARPKPTFRLVLNTKCASEGPYVNEFLDLKQQYVPGCSALVIPAGNVRLRIEYETMPLSVGDNVLNTPGVPGFASGVLEETAHQHKLNPSSTPSGWRGVAVRGNHKFLDPNPTATQLSLQITDDGSGGEAYLTVSPQTVDETVFAFFDDHSNTNIDVADLQAFVIPSDQNDLAGDPERNYRIEYVKASATTVSFGTNKWPLFTLSSERLIELREFDLTTGDNLMVKVTAPPAIQPVLLQPTGATIKPEAVIGMDADAVNQPEGKGQTRAFEFGNIPVGGSWALAFVNQAAPVSDPYRPQYPGVYYIDVSIQRCPEGTIPTIRYECQPLILPDTTPPPSRSVGNITVYSEEGFFDSGSDWCSKDGFDLPTNTIPPAVIVGPAQNDRWMYVAQGKMCYIEGKLFTTEESAVGLAVPIEASPPSQKLGRYVLHSFGSAAFYPLPLGEPNGWVELDANGRFAPIASTRIGLRPFKQYWSSEYSTNDIYIDPAEMWTESSGVLTTAVTIAADQAPLSRAFDTTWQYYPQQEIEYKFFAPRYHFLLQVDQQTPLPDEMDLSSLTLRILETGTNAIDSNLRQMESVKRAGGPSPYLLLADYARITQAAELGGASQTVQVVVNAPGKPLQPVTKNGAASCTWQSSPTSCLDIRRDDYKWENGKGEKVVKPWELPDIHLEESVGTLALTTPGALTVFSVDHPHAASNISQSFSFDTWEATVSVSQEVCDPDGPKTTVIHGSGFIALPTLGADGPHGAPQIQVDFKLCQTTLRTAVLSFDVNDESPPLPPIPIGSTGLGVTLIGGTVDIGPESTKVTINLDFQTLDGQTLSNGKGTLTIDTAGLFELQGSGQFLKGVLEADMTLQVAWNPFDMLVEGEATCCYGGDLISGAMRIHAWVGQGWQNKYPWLKPNNDFHFTGSISATLKIKSGDVVDDFPFVLPPFSVSLTAEVAFGEFCDNPDCTTQTWGASVTVNVLGYSVGLFVDSGGPSLILGSNGHKLVDQHCCAGNQTAQPQRTTINSPTQATNMQIVKPGQWQFYLAPPLQSPADNWNPESCTNISGAVHTCNFTVNPGSGRALFNINWQNGPLTIELLKPDNTVITAANAAAHGITYDAGNNSAGRWVSFAVADPPGSSVTPGEWKLRLSGVANDTNYGLLFAAEPPAPTVTWSFPVNAGEIPDSSGNVTLNWSALRGTEQLSSGIKAELFYVPLAQKPITPTIMTGNVISNGVVANTGSFTWNLAAYGLAAGDYAVGLRLDDHENGNGHVVSWAPGSIHFEDVTPPPIPTLTGKLTVNDGLVVAWLRDNATPDLAGYLVEYSIPDYNPDASPLPKVRRVLPSNPEWWPVFEVSRLGGLKNGWTTTVCVRAYDASGNISDCTATAIRVLDEPEIRLDAPEGLIATPLSDQDVLLEWFPPTQGDPDGYILNYTPYGCLVPGLDRSTESPPPPVLYDAGTLDSTIGGLTPGQTYRFLMRAFTNNGDISPPAVATARLLDSSDEDGDELPDQWEALYEAFEADDDLDEDGLSNYEEYLKGTDPLKADSDFDGFYDAEEMEWGTDPCSDFDRPPYHQQPKLVLIGPAAFKFGNAVNAGPAPSQALAVWNGGTGILNWTATSGAAWLVLNPTNNGDTGILTLSADPTGLTPGNYTAEITITAMSSGKAAAVGSETAVIPVHLTVLPDKMFELYLPVTLAGQ